jgi:hypothetical protein
MIYINIYSIVGRNFLKEIFCNPVGFNVFCKMGNWGVNGGIVVWIGVGIGGVGIGVGYICIYLPAIKIIKDLKINCSPYHIHTRAIWIAARVGAYRIIHHCAVRTYAGNISRYSRPRNYDIIKNKELRYAKTGIPIFLNPAHF